MHAAPPRPFLISRIFARFPLPAMFARRPHSRGGGHTWRSGWAQWSRIKIHTKPNSNEKAYFIDDFFSCQVFWPTGYIQRCVGVSARPETQRMARTPYVMSTGFREVGFYVAHTPISSSSSSSHQFCTSISFRRKI